MRTSSTKALGRRLITGALRSSSAHCPLGSAERVRKRNWDAASGWRAFGFLDSRGVAALRGLAMARGSIAVCPRAALPLMEIRKGFSSSEVRVDEGAVATGGIVEIPLAQTGEGIADCELIRWFVSEGDLVDEFAPVCEVQSDKASVVITSRYKGKVSQILHEPGDVIKVGETLLELMLLEGSPAELHPQASNPNSANPSISDPEPTAETNEGHPTFVLATPAVRALAKDFGLNLHNVRGTGPYERVTKADVLNHITLRENTQDDIQSLNEAPVRGEPQAASTVPRDYTPVPQGPSHGVFDGGDTVIPVRGHRRAMAKAMTAAASVPHVFYVEEIVMDKLTEIKRSLSEEVPLEAGVKLTHLPFLIKSLSMALKKFPVMNSTVDEAVTEIQVRAAHNVGIAMSTNHGLVVPNIKNVQRLSILEIATELSRLIQLANTNALSSEDITGGTITVSNIGAIGGKLGMPILNVPEVAIVAIGRMQQVVRPHESRDVKSHVINVTWGADHRVIDGATVAHFCNEWKLLIEQPERLLLTLQ